MIPPALAAALAAYDEAALTLLANKGLVRRAQHDVEEGKTAVTSVEDETAIVACDGETVRIDARGPRSATCTCPAPGVCRHRLAAVMMLQSSALPPSSDEDSAEPAPATPALNDEIAAVTIDAVRKWAGKASWRAAVEMAEGGGAVVQDGPALSITFADDGPSVRILPGLGLDGMVSKVKPDARKAWHAAAWLLARRHLGLAVAEEASPVLQSAEFADGPVAPAFLDAVAAALGDCCRMAFNLAPASLEERLFTLSVSSRADALPRLAAMLRRLSAQVRSRRLRDFTFDPDDCLQICSDAFALVSALRAIDETTPPDYRRQLQGVSRQDYAEVGNLRLFGACADAWTTASRARGVTGYFYDRDGDRWLTATLARGAGLDPGFEPTRAYRSESLWGGPPLDTLSHSEITLTAALVSPEGRLSGAAGVKVTGVSRRSAAEIAAWPCLFADWDALRLRLLDRLGEGQVEGERSEPVLLRPRRAARPAFDNLAQVLTWPVEDSNGRWLALSLEHGNDRAPLIAALEKVVDAGWSGVIVALASVDNKRFRLRPVALIDGGSGYNLGLDDISALTRQGLQLNAARLLRDVKTFIGQVPKTFVPAPVSPSAQRVHAVWQVLVEGAELGVGHAAATLRQALEYQARRLVDAGFPTLGTQMAAAASADPETLAPAFLTAAYAAGIARKLALDLPLLLPA